MKKLMLAAIAATAVGGAFAAPEVFDYKASVKYMYLKETPVSYKNAKVTVYTKYQKSASLKGYLIQDLDGVTSTTISGRGTDSTDSATAFDYGRNRAFLVVMSNSAEAKFRQPKILPAVLDAKFIDTNFKKAHAAPSGLAEGVLYVGGESIQAVRPQLDYLGATDQYGLIPVSRGAAPTLPGAQLAGMVTYADYAWTSCFLFGRFNGPNYFFTGGTYVPPFPDFEYAWDQNLPATLQVGFASSADEYNKDTWRSFYHDTWMNGTGIGKYIVPTPSKSEKLCCGLQVKTTIYPAALATLSGSLKGGIFLCTDNGIQAYYDDLNAFDYRFFDFWDGGRNAWDAQFFSGRLVNALGDAQDYTGDKWQFDLWQDGAVEQETTDVVFGNWSIKRNTKFLANKTVALSNAEVFGITAEDDEPYTSAADFAAAQPSRAALLYTLKGAVDSLKSSTSFFTGEEIFNLNAQTQVGVLPVVTPAFVKYYGL